MEKKTKTHAAPEPKKDVAVLMDKADSALKGRNDDLCRESLFDLYELVQAMDTPTGQHTIQFDSQGWLIMHPLQCRVDGLFNCATKNALASFSIPSEHGQYQLLLVNGRMELGDKVQ